MNQVDNNNLNMAGQLFFDALDGRRRDVADTLRQSSQAVAAALADGVPYDALDIMPALGRLTQRNVGIWQAIAAAVVTYGETLHEQSKTAVTMKR